MGKPMLTMEQVEAAKLDVSHPVVRALISMKDYCKHFNEEYAKVKHDYELTQEFLRRNIAPLADKINELNEFTLEPLDIISIWSQVNKSFSGLYIRYDLANIIPAKYGVIGIKSLMWGEFIAHESRTKRGVCDLPEDLMNDKENMYYFYRRLWDVSKSLDEIDLYKNGIKESVERSKKHDNTFLSEIHENFGNGFNSLLYFMPDEIRKQIFVED